MLTAGDKIAQYTVEARLGVGGMGEVYLAIDARLQRKVALKVILDQGEASGEPGSISAANDASARLVREARAAASLTHPNVVSVFDVGEDNGRVYLAMEYVVGRTVRELMPERDISWTRRVRWLADVARALAAAHKSGLVHRDIKPENVMVRDDGLVKVLDFGIARRTSSGPSVDPTARTEAAYVSTVTAEGVAIGTPLYMAPEQIKGGVVDARTDQFAWGVMAFEVLSGGRPWPDKSDLLAFVAAVLTEPPASLAERAPELPPAIAMIVARALAREPGHRFDSMDEIADALDPLATSSPSTQPNTAASPPPAPAASSRPLEAAAGAGIADAPTATTAAPVTKLSALFPGARAKRPRKRRWHFVLGVVVTLLASVVYYKFPRKPVVVTPINPAPSVSVASVPVGPLAPDVKPEAKAAYLEASQLWRDGAESRGRSAFERAVQLDSGIAAAHLRLAVLMFKEDPADAQEHFQRAFSFRARLAPDDLVLLDAMAPLMRPIPDLGEAEAKLDAATKARSKVALYWYLLGAVRQERTDFERASRAYKESTRIDPAFMPGWRAEGDAQRMLGDAAAALSAYDACVKASPAAATCLRQRISLLQDMGECDRLEADARAWQAVEPEASTASYWLAEALLVRGAPVPAVEAALKRQWDAQPKEARAAGEAEDRANLDIFQGDFARAEQRTREWEAAITRPELMLHARSEHQLALLAFETGDVARAGKVADDFIKVLPALTPDPRGADPSLWFQEYLFRSGRIKKAELDARRRAWLASQEVGKTPREIQRFAPFRWAMIYAGFAETQEEANEAFAVLPLFLPLPPDSRRTMSFAADYGKAAALAGRFDEAIPLLELVTRACIALDSPGLQTRSFFFLGQAREGKGDLEGARKAYQIVVDRWGTAKPKSVTAEKAKARLHQLE